MSEEDKKINSFKKYIQFQESTLDDYYKLDEEYFKDQIEQLELSIKLLKNILNLIEEQQKELNSLKEIEQLHKEENGKLRVELEQMKQKVEEYRIGWCNTGEELEQEKLKNKDMKSAVEYLKKIEPEKLKIIADSWNEKVMTNLEKEWICKDKIKEKIEELEKEQKEYKNSQEWEIQDDIVAQISILEDLLEEN